MSGRKETLSMGVVRGIFGQLVKQESLGIGLIFPKLGATPGLMPKRATPKKKKPLSKKSNWKVLPEGLTPKQLIAAAKPKKPRRKALVPRKKERNPVGVEHVEQQKKTTPAKQRRRAEETPRVDTPCAREPGEGKRTPDHWQQLFLRTLAATCDVSASCRAANISREWAYVQKRNDEQFAAAWADALEQSTDTLVGEVYRRATNGVEKLQFIKSGPMAGMALTDPRTGKPYIEREYSDTLALKLLSAHRPEVYAEKSKVELSGTVNNGAITAPDELVAYVHSALPGFLAAIHKTPPTPQKPE